jgi:hypothetical protein
VSAVASIKPHIASIRVPEELATLPGWLVWRYEHHDGEAKPRKVPYYVNGGRRHGVQGRPEDRAQLTTLEAAKAAAARRGMDGVGLALMPEFDVVALDFDRCLVDGAIHPEVERLVAGTYAEWSPSGEGVRAFMRGGLGNAKSAAGPFGFEVFSSKGFVTVTGNRLEVTDIMGAENTVSPLTSDVTDLCQARFGNPADRDDADPLMTYEPRLGLTDDQIREALDVLDPDCDRVIWRNAGMAVHHETQGEGFHLWRDWSIKGEKYPGDAAIRQQWESFGKGEGRLVTARTLIRLAKENGAYIVTTVSPEQFAAESATPTEKPARFQLIQAHQFTNARPTRWLVKGVLPAGELAVMFGESGSGKSFLALDICAAIARGIDWRGHKVPARGRVVYVAAEGAGGFRKRLSAYAMHHGIELDQLDIWVLPAAPNLLEKADAVAVARAIAATGPADLVVVDTFAQTMPGANENSGEDVGKALAHCKGIHVATGATVMLIHHAGKDTSKGARGWSGLKAAADTEIEVLRFPAGRVARLSKQKDGEDGAAWGFDLQVVPVGMDEDGDVIDSCVVVEAEVVATKAGQSKRRLGPWEQAVMAVVGEMSQAQSTGIEVEAVVAEVARRQPAPEAGKRDTRKQHAKRALVGLAEGEDAPFWIEGDSISML